ncbi:YadA-like family protein, partial [Salmonella enterica subsp. enterica]
SIIEANDEMTSYTDNSSKNTYNKAVEYTDSKVQEGNSYAIDISKNYTDASSQKTLNQATTYTDNRFNQAIDYTNSQINSVNGRIDNLDSKVDDNRKKASAGIAGAMAMSSIPQNLSYDFNFGMGVANFDSEQAISAGGYYRVNERTTVSLKTSFDTQNNLGAAAGVSYGW